MKRANPVLRITLFAGALVLFGLAYLWGNKHKSSDPVQISAADMDLRDLKREFGRDLVFWGGGVDTQHVLDQGTPQEVQEDVKRNIEALAPGGGFVFAAVHYIQANVPPENIMAMWQAWQQYGVYDSHKKQEEN